MKKITTYIATLLMCAGLQAQDQIALNVSMPDASDFVDSNAIIRNYNTQLDSLVNLWYVQQAGGISFSEHSKKHYDSTYVPKFSNRE